MNHVDTLEQLRAWRDEFAKSHGYDLHAMATALREFEEVSERTVIHGAPRLPIETSILDKSLQPLGGTSQDSEDAKNAGTATGS